MIFVVCPAMTNCSVRPVASPSRMRSTSISVVKPWVAIKIVSVAPSGQDASSSSARRRVGCRPWRRSRGVGIRQARRAMPWLYKTPAHGPASSFFGLAAQSRGGSAAGLLPPPARGERGHRSLARWLVAVRRRAVFVVAVGQRPHPGAALQSNGHEKDAADDNAVFQALLLFLVRPDRRALEDQRGHCSGSSPI